MKTETSSSSILEPIEAIDSILRKIKNLHLSADIYLLEKQELSISCRKQEKENISKASEINVYASIIKNKKRICITTNNIKKLEDDIMKAATMLEYLQPDEHINLALNDHLLELNKKEFKPAKEIDALSDEFFLLMNNALLVEKAALEFSEITNSNGAKIERVAEQVIFANTNGLLGRYIKENLSASIEVIAGQGTHMNTGYDYYMTGKNQYIDYVKLGKHAAKYAIEGLNPRKVDTCQASVIFNARTAGALLKNFASAVNAANITQSVTFLQNDLNKTIFPVNINIIDDPLCEDAPGYASFDAEGMLTQKQYIVENGILKTWLLDLYTAHKLGLTSNGCAKRLDGGSISPSYRNFYLQVNNSSTEQELINDIKEGLYVTDVFGFGVNNVTGDYSQGVKGFWILKGKLVYPVSEITIAGNLRNMFQELKAASNLEFKSTINSPSLYVGKMTISGK